MSVTAAQVKELRELTQAPMMECKKALMACNGNIEAAISELYKLGKSKAQKKSGRIAAEGIIAISTLEDGQAAAMVEVNSETDFVARETRFQKFVVDLAALALKEESDNIEHLSQSRLSDSGMTVEEARLNLIHTLGENIKIRRVIFGACSEGTVAVYVHGGEKCGRIGALVALKNSQDLSLARNLAMHVAAMAPDYLTIDEIPETRKALELERAKTSTADNEVAQTPEKKETIIKKALNKSLLGLALMSQGYIRNPKKSVSSLFENTNIEIAQFVRFEVGLGIEKKEDNFVAEVMSQVNQTS